MDLVIKTFDEDPGFHYVVSDTEPEIPFDRFPTMEQAERWIDQFHAEAEALEQVRRQLEAVVTRLAEHLQLDRWDVAEAVVAQAALIAKAERQKHQR